MSALPSAKIERYEYLTVEEILLPNQTRIMMKKKAKFTYYSLGKALEKQIKTIENQGEKQKKNHLKSMENN